MDGPTARLGGGSKSFAVHHPVSNVSCTVVLDSFGNRGRKLRTTAKGDAEDVWYRHRHGVQRKYRVPLRRNAHPLDQGHGSVHREQLAFMVMGKTRQGLVHKLYAAAVEERPIAGHCHQHRPTAVIRYPDDAAILRHDRSSHLTDLSAGVKPPDKGRSCWLI